MRDPERHAADRNLLFGILALQMEFIDRDALVAAMNAWVLDKKKSLGVILQEQGKLISEHLQLLEGLVAAHLKLHNNDPAKSLASVSTLGSARQELEQVADADVLASLTMVGTTRSSSPDVSGAYVRRDAAGAPVGVRYRVLRPHARGGLGEVFVAEDRELHREVALKEIQDRYAHDPVSRGRFVLEAEVTGGLEHPGIVPVYGLGTYADGRPFYAMRFIKGDSLKDAIQSFHKADAPGRDPGERSMAFRQLLARFVDVCNAVAYAHSRGVLHRDLKPGNIMLGKYGETLLVDWGLAKPVGRPELAEVTDTRTFQPSSGSGASLTEAGSIIGTPAYMSPEQASGNLDQLSSASDVYSLGATLYTLLTGQIPFPDPDQLLILAKVQKGEFNPPRQVMVFTPPALEAVCLKAMALKPPDRYGSARALADDIEHWLADEPVFAWREPWRARMGRWARRHRPVVTGAAALLVTAVVALAVGLVAVQRERDQKDQALQAETRAREAETEARALATSSLAQKERALKAETKAREAETQARTLAMGALRKLTDDVVEQQLARRTALTDEDRRFLRDIQQQYEAFAKLPGEEAEQRAVRAEGHLRVGLMRDRLGDVKEAEASYRRAQALYEELTAAFPSRDKFRQGLGQSRNNLGLLLQSTDRPKEAEAAYAVALAIRTQLAAEFPSRAECRQELAASHHNVAVLFFKMGRLQEAEAAYGRARDILKQLATDFPAHPDFAQNLAKCHNNLGYLLYTTGRRNEAEATYGAALAILKRLDNDFPARPEFRRDLAMSYANLGILLNATGRLKEAEAAKIAGLTILKQLADDFPLHPEFRQFLAMSQNNLATLYKDMGRLDEAAVAYAAAEGILKQLVADFPSRAEFRQSLAHSHWGLGALFKRSARFGEAEAAYTRARTILNQLAADFPKVPDYSNEVAGILGDLATIANARRDFSQAQRWLEEAQPRHHAALLTNPKNGSYRRYYRNGLSLLTQSYAGQGESTAAVATATKVRDLGWNPADDTYDAACSLALCIPIVEKDDTTNKEAREKRMQFYSDQAMNMLRDAVANGYKDAAYMKKDTDLDPLRKREDFKALIAELEKKAKTKTK